MIRAEKRSLFFTMEYSLIVDGEKQDQLLGTYGIFSLHGFLAEGETKLPVEVLVQQGFLSTKFFLKAESNLFKMHPYDPNAS